MPESSSERMLPPPQRPASADAQETFPVEQHGAPDAPMPGAGDTRVLACPQCSTSYDVKNWAHGRDVRCPSCGAALNPPATAGVIDAAGPLGARSTLGDREPRGVPFGRYHLLSELGRGGMGVVFKAWDTQLKRVVALKKILSTGEESRVQVERFMREARLAAKLRHAHIVGVLDVGSVDGQHYFTSAYIEGASLFQAMRGPAPLRQRVGWIHDIAEALYYAHTQGVVHRDVKPENILLDPEGRPLIMDFGLAKEMAFSSSDDRPALTVSGIAIGTPAYMSPEQARGVSEAVGPASDQYSLGAVLYHLITGRLPHDEVGFRELMNAVIERDPLPPSRINASVHRDLEAITLKALEKDPSRRYADTGELAADLGRYLAGEPIRARPVSWAGRLARKMKRNRAVTGLAASLTVTALAAIGLVAWFAILPRIRAERHVRAAEEAIQARHESARALCAAARSALAAGHLDEAAADARRVVDDCTPFSAKGEDLPVAEAHALLGEVSRARGDARLALVEGYRAFEAAIGRPEEAATLVQVAGQLAEMNETESAARLFDRALAASPAPRDAFLAKLGAARLLLRDCRFDEARALLQSIADDGQATAGERAEVSNLLGFLDLVGGGARMSLPGFDPGQDVCFTDLDGHGATYAYAITEGGRGVALARVEGKTAKEIGRVRVLRDEPYRLSHVMALDLDGDGQRELVCGGGSADTQQGTLAVVRLRDGRLEVAARTPLQSSLYGRPFAVADLLGDGRRELIVGTGVYERGLRVYRYDDARGSLGAMTSAPIPLGGDSIVLLTRDKALGGRAAIWAFVGAWTTFGVEVFAADPRTKEVKLVAQAPLSEAYSVDAAEAPLPGQPLLVGTGWTEMVLQSFPAAVGKEKFESTWRRPGLYEVRLDREGALDVKTVWQPADRKLWEGTCGVTLLRGKRGTYAWTTLPPDPALQGGRAGARARLWRSEGGSWTPMASLDPPASLSGFQTYDFDRDGADDVYYSEPAAEGAKGLTIRVLGTGRTAGVAEAPQVTPTPRSTARLPRRAEIPALVTARETEQARLYQEAWDGYSRALRSSLTEEDLLESANGLIRCGVAMRHCQETAAAVYPLLDKYPMLARAIGGALLDALEDAGSWKTALACVEALRSAPGLTSEDEQALRDRQERLRSLAEPKTSLEWRTDARRCDLLATTPFAAALDDDGSMTFFGCSYGLRELFVPLENDGSSWRMDATVEVQRHEWAIDMEMGIAAGDPAAAFVGDPHWTTQGGRPPRAPAWLGIWMAAEGETNHPSRFWELRHDTELDRDSVRWRSGLGAPATAQEVSIEYAPHQRRLRFGDVRLENVSLTDARVYFALGSSGRAVRPEYWAALRISDLRLRSGGGGVKPAEHAVARAVDAMMLANGRWIQGRREEALRLYDLAVSLGDEEAEREEALRRRGLSSRFDSTWGGLEKRVAIDARVWRGLLRAETGNPKDARADLLDARKRDSARFEEDLATSALPLEKHPHAAAVLQEVLGEIEKESPR